MSYDSPDLKTYSFTGINFGSGNSTRYIKGPAGKMGKVTEILVASTTSFVGTSTPAYVNIGPSGSLTEHANLPIGAAGAGPAAGTCVRASDSRKTSLPNSSPYTIPEVYVEADTVQLVNFVAPTGGSPAGIADVFITIDWDK